VKHSKKYCAPPERQVQRKRVTDKGGKDGFPGYLPNKNDAKEGAVGSKNNDSRHFSQFLMTI
jgi:hypothetical protein